jgi:hypothetical protein
VSRSFPLSDLHETQSAPSKLGEFGMVAQTGNIDVVIQGCLENVRAFRGAYWFIIDNKIYYIHFIAKKLHFS